MDRGEVMGEGVWDRREKGEVLAISEEYREIDYARNILRIT